MDTSNSPPKPEMYCPECRAILAPELRDRLFQGESVFCEMCGSKYPEIKVDQIQSSPLTKKESSIWPQRNAFKEEFRKQSEYLKGWGIVFKDEWQKYKKDQQERQKQRQVQWKQKWQDHKRRLQSRWQKWKERWRSRQDAKKQASLQQQPQSALQNILLTPANFDPLTGKRVAPQPLVSDRPVFRFNPRTGQPLSGQNNLKFRYDPLTGKPLQQAQIQLTPQISSAPTSIPNPTNTSAQSLSSEPVNSPPIETAIPDPRKMAFDPITGEPILEGFIKDRIFTVLDPVIRDRLLHLNVSEEDRSVLAQAMVFLTVEQQSKYITELERVNNPNISNDQAIIQALRALPIHESDKQSIINQLSYIPEDKHPEFVAQMVNLQSNSTDSTKITVKPVPSSNINSETQIPSNEFKDQLEKPKEKKKTRERELA